MMGDDQARGRAVTVAATAVRPARNRARPPVRRPLDPLGAATGAGGVGRPAVLGGAGRCWPRVACEGMGDLPFFGPDAERADSRARRVGRAKAICATCPALLQCRAFALRTGQAFGIWGGLSEEELRFMRRGSGPARTSWKRLPAGS